MKTELINQFPNLMKVLKATTFGQDITKAEGFRNSGNPGAAFESALENQEFKSNKLAYSLFWGIFTGHPIPLPVNMEADLAKVSTCIEKFEEISKAYRSKLVNDIQFEDVTYEIAATAIFCDLFEVGSMGLEVPLHKDTKKNPDITGTWDKRKARAEVTVLHDDFPPRHDPACEREIERAEVKGGFILNVNFPLTDLTLARRAREMVEALAEGYTERPGQKIVVDGFEFSSRNEEYRCDDPSSPVKYIEFNDIEDCRLVQGTAFTRETMTAAEASQVKEDHPDPEVTYEQPRPEDQEFATKGGPIPIGKVYRSPDPRDRNFFRTHERTPVGQTVFDKFVVKILGQLESGAINVIVLGQPSPWNDKAVHDALAGSAFALVGYTQDKAGLKPDGPSSVHRTLTGPFVPEALVPMLPPHRQAATQHEIDRFRKLSGILVLRIDSGYPLAEVIANPNASVSIPDAEIGNLRKLAEARSTR